ncbi:hypothetical protein ACIBSW_31655 [Actinoplanes sp. NPDC049668]|uniref:hypothetical protein n=1 Tax=unclassified Actinoplanes TaxID=2626549 RepID=UPI0033BC1C60
MTAMSQAAASASGRYVTAAYVVFRMQFPPVFPTLTGMAVEHVCCGSADDLGGWARHREPDRQFRAPRPEAPLGGLTSYGLVRITPQGLPQPAPGPDRLRQTSGSERRQRKDFHNERTLSGVAHAMLPAALRGHPI